MNWLTRITALLLAISVPNSALASDDAATPFEARYIFYIGGLSIAEIAFEGRVSSLGYDAASAVETRGILDLLVGGKVTAQSSGYRHTRGHLSPDAYRTEYSTRSESRAVSIKYKSELADVQISPPEAPKPYDTEPSLHEGALDPVTAAVTMMTPDSEENLCNRTIPVFDGKRRYDIILLPLKHRPSNEDLPPQPSWDNPMTRCFGVYERIAGFEADLQREQRYFPFDIWFENDGSALHRIVRLAGKTRLGFAIGTLQK